MRERLPVDLDAAAIHYEPRNESLRNAHEVARQEREPNPNTGEYKKPLKTSGLCRIAKKAMMADRNVKNGTRNVSVLSDILDIPEHEVRWLLRVMESIG